MFLDAFYKGLIGFFELALINCKSEGLPQWLLVISPWPIVATMFLYLGFTSMLNRNLGNRDPMDPDQLRRVRTYYTAFHMVVTLYINFNTMVDFRKTSVSGEKLLLVRECSVCSCFMVMWLAVVVTIMDIFVNAVLLFLAGEQVNCVHVMYQIMRPLNMWLQFQFYQRESALAVNILTLGELVRNTFSLAHRYGARMALSISSSPDLLIVTTTSHSVMVFLNGLFLILSANLDIRLVWWNMEYGMISMVLLSLLSGWQEFRTGMFFIVVNLANFVLLGSYAVYWGDRTIFPCVRTCITESPANIVNVARRISISPETGVVGPAATQA